MKKKSKLLVVMMLILASLIGLMPAGAVDADMPAEDRLVRIRYPYNGNYLTVDSDDNGARIKQKPLDPSDESFVFRLHHTDRGTKIYTLTGKVVEIRNSSHEDWAEAAIWSNHDGDCARWDLVPSSGDTVKFRNCNSGKMLNVCGCDGEDLIQYHEDDTQAERFILEDYDTDILVRIKYSKSGRYLDIPLQGVWDNGTQLQLWDLYTGNENQIFRLHPTGDGYWQIFSVLTNKLIEVRNSSHNECTAVAQWDAHGLDCGQWKVRWNKESRTFSFQNRESGLFLNVAGGEGGNGNPIWQYHDDQTIALDFELMPLNVDYLNRRAGQRMVDVASEQLYSGGKPFWDWHGSYVQYWCALFVCWTADQCGYLNEEDDDVIPKELYCPTSMNWYQSRGQWLDPGEKPEPGMIVFFDWEHGRGRYEGYKACDHTGIVAYCDGDKVHTIEGNMGDTQRVGDRTFSVNYGAVLGYGIPAYWKAPLLTNRSN